MRTIHCIATDAPCKSQAEDTTVNWRVRYEAAQALYLQQLQDPANADKRITYFELRVPDTCNNEDVKSMAQFAAFGEFYRPIMRREPVLEVA